MIRPVEARGICDVALPEGGLCAGVLEPRADRGHAEWSERRSDATSLTRTARHCAAQNSGSAIIS